VSIATTTTVLARQVDPTMIRGNVIRSGTHGAATFYRITIF
jgi:hypothetical protein